MGLVGIVQSDCGAGGLMCVNLMWGWILGVEKKILFEKGLGVWRLGWLLE